jgi:mono/diheme cytochrome c family protein
MNRSFKTIKLMALSGLILVGLSTSCKSDPNSPGMEYMPDMYRSASIETYVDYGEFKGKYVDSLVKENPSLLPPLETVPYTSSRLNDLPYSHGAPYGYDKSHGLYEANFDSTGYVDAATDVNPLAYSEDLQKEGKRLYGNFCIHCHGAKGDGQGSVVTNSNGAFPAPPSYTSAALKDLPGGQIFFSVTYGKGLMGSHASQLTKEERWKVVYYVQSLQGKVLGTAVDSVTTNVVIEEKIEDAISQISAN